MSDINQIPISSPQIPRCLIVPGAPGSLYTLYLGDGAYAGLDVNDLVICTSDGMEVTNVVVLEYAAVEKLGRLVRGEISG